MDRDMVTKNIVQSKSNNINSLGKSEYHTWGKKKYHTLINQRRYYSSSCKENTKEYDKINNKNDLDNKQYKMLDIKSDSFLNIFLHNLSKFIDDDSITWEDKQFKLEENWLSFFDNYNKYEKIFTKNYNHLTDILLINAMKTLQLKMDSGTIKKKFRKNKSKNNSKNEYLR